MIAVENGRIAACGSRSELPVPADAELPDAKGSYVSPGFVDLHVHGGNGHFFYAEPEAAEEIGSIAPEKRANLVLVDDMFQVKAGVLEGEIWPQQAISPIG